jgi:hypothetical protein
MHDTLSISGYVFAVVFAFLGLIVFGARMLRRDRARPVRRSVRRPPMLLQRRPETAVRPRDCSEGYSAEDFVNPMSPHFAWRPGRFDQENDRHW